MKTYHCGTPTGYRGHAQVGEKACDGCRVARNNYRRNAIAEKGRRANPLGPSDSHNPHSCTSCGKKTSRSGMCSLCTKYDNEVSLTGGQWVYRGSVARWIPEGDVA